MSGFKLDARFCILLSVLVFMVPFPWLVSWVVAVSFHEMCHWIVMKFYGGNMRSFFIGLGGANMQCSGLSDREYLLSILAGPIGGFVLVLLGRWFPRLSICSWLLSAYNLLPVLPLDGGQVLRILVKNDTVFCVLERIVLILVSILAVITSLFMNLGPLPFIIVASLWVKKRKRPCKETVCAVQ